MSPCGGCAFGLPGFDLAGWVPANETERRAQRFWLNRFVTRRLLVGARWVVKTVPTKSTLLSLLTMAGPRPVSPRMSTLGTTAGAHLAQHRKDVDMLALRAYVTSVAGWGRLQLAG